MRSGEGLIFLKKLNSQNPQQDPKGQQFACRENKSDFRQGKNNVICAADLMRKTPLLLEAWRKKLYKEMPVPNKWHKDYAQGKADTKLYRKWRSYSIN